MSNNKFALIVSYYLSRFDREALANLGFNSFNQAFEETAKRLNVKKNYVKLRRDEFDPAFPWRTGWQRPMDPQIIRTIESFQDLGEFDVREIVLKILNNQNYLQSDEINNITALLQESKTKVKRKGKFILRGPTGKQAEEFFINHFNINKRPFNGTLKDMRDMGCGYDFELRTGERVVFIEVKGLAELAGGIVFTNKEWQTALTSGNSYFLVLVKNLGTEPEIIFIENPALKLTAKKNIFTTVQIQWTVSESELKK
jgi:hypothetical protein